MRAFEGEQVLARIFLRESDKWQHQALAKALLGRLRHEGIAGATVYRGTVGFGARSALETHMLGLPNSPVVIEVVDSEDKIQRLLPILDEMVTKGLVTMEKVKVIKYSPRMNLPASS